MVWIAQGEPADMQRMMDEWVPIAGGTGAINVQVSFKPAQASFVYLKTKLALTPGTLDDR